MIYEQQEIKDLYLIKPQEFKDPRGSTLETYRQLELNKVVNKDINFVQLKEDQVLVLVRLNIHKKNL